MTLLQNLSATSNADLIGNDANPTLTLKNTAATGTVLQLVSGTSATAGATIAPLTIVASTASQALISIQGVFVSTASINLAANKTAFIIPVYHATQAVWGYLAASVGVS